MTLDVPHVMCTLYTFSVANYKHHCLIKIQSSLNDLLNLVSTFTQHLCQIKEKTTNLSLLYFPTYSLTNYLTVTISITPSPFVDAKQRV